MAVDWFELAQGVTDRINGGLAGWIGPRDGLALDWRPIGMTPTPEQLDAQMQRERGYAFWRAHRAVTAGVTVVDAGGART